MNRTRQGVAFLIVAALAVFTLLAWRPTDHSVAAAPPATTTTTAAASTTTTAAATTSSAALPVDRDSEIVEILTDFYFGWFDGIHREDVATLDRVAGSDTVLEQGIEAFGNVAFTAAPTRDDLGVVVKHVLLDRPDCLVVSADIDFRAFVATDEVMPAVDVFFRVGDGWGRAESYKYEKEMWEFTCDHMPRR